jgi:TPP-dependent 2-oxoacid decarboxylase
MSGMSPQTVPLNIYLWRRIASIGIEHVFGVPGDFNRKLKRPKPYLQDRTVRRFTIAG